MLPNRFRRSPKVLLVLVALLATAGMLWAQAGTGDLTGIVTDPTGAVITKTTVTLANNATAEKRTTLTSDAGVYRFSSLPIVGTYTLEVAPKGFRPVIFKNIIISVGMTSSLDVALEVGSANESVTVEAGAEVVQTSQSSISHLVDRSIWQQMPLEVRNQNSFIELVPGAVPQNDTGNNRGAAVNGTREGAGSYLVEGVDNNEQGQAGRGQIGWYDQGGAATSISPDAIQEYRVITNAYSAEYGKGGGFITDTVLKGGTNQWHGSVFEYNRIQALTANDFFSSREGIRDHLVRNQFGGSIGGPIVKGKTFFFGTGEIHRARQSSPITTTGTTQQFLDFVNLGSLQTWAESDPNGICVVNLGAACPAGTFSGSATMGPVFKKLLASQPYPLATSYFSSIGAGVWDYGLTYPVPVYGQVTVSDPQVTNEARWTLKMDHRFSDVDTIAGIYLFQDATTVTAFDGGFNTIGPQYTVDGRGQTAGITWNHTFSPTLLNAFKVGYLRHKLNFPASKEEFGVPQYYTIDGMGVDFGQYSGLPQFFTDNQFQYLDTLSFIRGKHSFKVGAEYRRTRNGSSFYNDIFSSVLPWSIQDTVTDLAFSDQFETYLNGGDTTQNVYGGAYYMSAAINPSTGQSPLLYRGYRANEFASFFQDDWRVNNRLTVNLGLRWEYFGPPHNFRPNIDSNFYFGTPVTPIVTTSTNPFFPVNNPFYAQVATGSFQVRNNEIWNKDTNNFGPRAGFAWDVFGTQKFVIRGGGGVMYDRIYNNAFENIRFNPPYFSDNRIGYSTGLGIAVGAYSTPGLLSYPFTSLSMFNDPSFAPKANPRHMDQNIVTPYYEQVHFGFQWEFAKGYVFEPNYIGTFGHKLIGLTDINVFNGLFSGLGSTRPNTSISADNYRNNGFSSNYHGLQMTVRKAYSNGLSFNVNYTYAKALDDMSDLFNNRAGGHPTDNMNVHTDYGPADFDLRHRIVGTLSYELPLMKNNRWLGGWGTNTIVSFQTGHPFSLFNGNRAYDLNKDGYYTDRIVPVDANGIPLNISPASTILSSSPADGYFDASKWGLVDASTGQIASYSCPASINLGYWCNAPIGRNTMFGPKFANVDFNLTKKFKVTERVGMTFQANFFDLFNRANFTIPGRDINNLSTFGKSIATLGDNGGHRITQLALRLDF